MPAAQRKLVSDHDAFGYFAHRYGIAIVGAVIPSQTTQAQASAADIAALVRLVRRERVRAIFPESSLSTKLAQQIARETGARAGYTLYGDTLGPKRLARARPTSRWSRRTPNAMTRGFTGGARGCRIAGAAMTLVAARDLAVGYDGTAVLDGLTFSVEPGQRLGVLGPNGGGKSTLLRALLGELTPLAGSARAPARCSVVPQTERSRLDYPVTALDVAVMGSVSRLPWWRRPGRRERRRALAALAEVGLERARAAGRSASSRAASASACWSRARSCRTPASCCSTSRSPASTRASAEVLAALIDRLAAEGRGVLIATHDVDQARGFDRVLCLNGRQIAFGAPDVLTRPVLEATYGGAIVAVDDGSGGRRAASCPAHHHEHGHGHD